MQWDSSPNAGFTTGTPWLPIPDSYRDINVESEARDARSMLTLYRNLIALRRGEPALSIGGYAPIPAVDDVLAFQRSHGSRRFAIVLNLGATPARLTLPEEFRHSRIRLSTAMDHAGTPVNGIVDLRADEGVIVEIDHRQR